jgi:hypothetical protein
LGKGGHRERGVCPDGLQGGLHQAAHGSAGGRWGDRHGEDPAESKMARVPASRCREDGRGLLQGPQQQGSAGGELSVDLEKEREAERLAQLGAMEAEVGKLREANRRGDMGSLMRGHETLDAQLKEYLKGIEANEEDRVSSDLTGKWRKAATD